MINLNGASKNKYKKKQVYLRDVNFYKACNLGCEPECFCCQSHLFVDDNDGCVFVRDSGQDRIDNADQRVTADIVQFSEELADLYTTVFKPCLDIVLFTGKLAEFIGWQVDPKLLLLFCVSLSCQLLFDLKNANLFISESFFSSSIKSILSINVHTGSIHFVRLLCRVRRHQACHHAKVWSLHCV